MSLRWRIAVAMGALAAVVASLASVGAFALTSSELRASTDRLLRTQVRDVGAGPDLDPSDDDGPTDGAGGRGRDLGDEGCPPVAVVRTLDAAQVVDDDGTVHVCLADGPELPASITAALSTVRVDDRVLRVATAPYHGGGTLLLARDTAATDDVLASLRGWLIGMTVCVSAVAGLIGWWIARRLVRPVVRLRDAAHSIAATGDLTTPVDVRGAGEVGDLARSVRAMVDSLATSREQQRRLVADAGHELRTPLTSLTTNVELVERLDELPSDEQPEVLRAIRADVRELADLAEELIDLATDRSNDEPVQDVELVELAERVVSVWTRRSGRSIEVVHEGQGTVPGRPLMLERCIGNLVQNAVKYSPADTPIELRVRPGELRVLDRGPGIAHDDAARVFERFYRTDAARSVPGSGLGLAIVAQVVERHGGVVWATTRADGRGADVGFRLPGA